MLKIIYILCVILTIASCNDLKNQKLNLDNPVEDCLQSPLIDEYELIEPVIPVTTVERKEPISLVSRIEFITRLRHSELWNTIKYKFDENEDYSDTFTFDNSEGYIRILGEDYINNITYGFNNAYIKDKSGHMLNEREKFEMEQTLNLIIEDEEASKKLLDNLYSDYLYKIDNEIVLSKSSTGNYKIYHAHRFYEGILFELWGLKASGHSITECNLNMIEKLTIS